MKYVISLLSLSVLLSCTKTSNTMEVKGLVKDLRKGTLYLKKIQDSSLVTIDSIVINGDPHFKFEIKIDEPELFYLELNKYNNTDNRIAFFGDKGVTQITTHLKTFGFDAKITGSKHQKIYNDYLKIKTKFNSQNLTLIKDNFDAQVAKDTLKLNQSKKAQDNLLKRKYLYTVNYALTNKDSEVAPYLALSEIYDAHVKWLDTINNALTPRVKKSKYGKALNTYIVKRKE